MTNVLVVDDELDAGDLYRQQFRREVRAGHFNLHVATSGPEALDILEKINSDKPIIILSDINMPGMNGIELLKIIKQRWPDLEVVMVSAYAGNEVYLNEARIHGASDFISKPIDFERIKTKLVSNG